MQNVLISIQPKWVEKILTGEKTLEIRKSKPKLETPFKVYIYCTKGSGKFCNKGKVVGEFICNKIYQYSTSNVEGINIDKQEVIEKSCLTELEIEKYEFSANPKEGCFYYFGLYLWHVSDLKIYDKPKELNEFYKSCGEKPNCEFCEYHYTESNESVGSYEECCSDIEGCKPLTRPPQSWGYVYEK